MATIEINDRLYNEFVVWAQANNMNDNDMQKYIEKSFRDKFTLDKYGDLNDKITKAEPKKPRKKVAPKPSEPVTELTDEPINEPIHEPINEPIKEEKLKRKTKVIASK